jgi:hypothetical protein
MNRSTELPLAHYGGRSGADRTSGQPSVDTSRSITLRLPSRFLRQWYRQVAAEFLGEVH